MSNIPIVQTLAEAITANQTAICAWFRHRVENHRPRVYASVDVRVSDYKVSVVDTNLFPAGFNNVYRRDLQMASTYFEAYVRKYVGQNIRKIVIIPEDHTRNRPYFSNLAALQEMVRHAGFEVVIGSLSPELRKDFVDVDLLEGGQIRLHRAFREGSRLRTIDMDPDMIFLNNDCSQEPPAALVGIEQPIAPPYEAGWHSRRKSRHFAILQELMTEFATILKVDPWVLLAHHGVRSDVDLHHEDDRRKLANLAHDVLKKTREDLKRHQRQEEPFIFMKDNSGTYGFAVMNVANPDDILSLNSKEKKKLTSGKGRASVREFLIQEGVPTSVKVDGCVAEPCIYLVGADVIGGFYRKHCNQTSMQSLNVQGSVFSMLTFASPVDMVTPPLAVRDDDLLKVCGHVAKIAAIALALEVEELLKGGKRT